MIVPGTILQQRYQILRPIGQGGMGAVYEATDTRLGNVVALKQTLVPGGEFSKAFEREARLLASLRHPALPKVTDHFVDEGGQYLVMEYIPGDDFGTLLDQRQSPFPVGDMLHWADQLLRVLEYLHTRNPPVLHRDIKPQNLKLTTEGEIVLLDFGLAKGQVTPNTQASHAGSVFGYTPHYAPIEQIHNSGTDPRSDLYALAATLHHLLTGVKPADALSRATAVLRRQPDPLGAPTDLNPRVTPQVSAVLMQALALSLDERPPSAAAMREALAEARRAAPTPLPWTALTAIPSTPPHSPLNLPPEHSQVAPRPNAPPADRRSPSEPSRPGSRRASTTTRLVKLEEPGARWLAALRSSHLLWPGVVAVALLLVMTIALAARSGQNNPAQRPTTAPTTVLVSGAATVPATALPRPTTPPPTDTPPPTSTTPPTATAASLTPESAFVGISPLVITVRGTHLDRVGTFRLVASGGPEFTPEVQSTAPDQVILVVAQPPTPVVGDVTFVLHLDDTPQPVAIVLRDYLERRTIRGVLPEYRYTGRITEDQSGPAAAMLAEPNAASAAAALVRNGDEVDVLRSDMEGWYQVRLTIRSQQTETQVVGWMERWLVDNQGAPQIPVFAGRLGQTPTDRAVQCGTQFKSSVYGSVELPNGAGIGGALVRVTSADGRNRFAQRTGRGGTFNIGGLGCTTWIVELLEVPGVSGFQANAVRVRNLNGGQYTAAEVRFRQQ
jgi:serine/threonine protein kinase